MNSSGETVVVVMVIVDSGYYVDIDYAINDSCFQIISLVFCLLFEMMVFAFDYLEGKEGLVLGISGIIYML